MCFCVGGISVVTFHYFHSVLKDNVGSAVNFGQLQGSLGNLNKYNTFLLYLLRIYLNCWYVTYLELKITDLHHAINLVEEALLKDERGNINKYMYFFTKPSADIFKLRIRYIFGIEDTWFATCYKPGRGSLLKAERCTMWQMFWWCCCLEPCPRHPKATSWYTSAAPVRHTANVIFSTWLSGF